MEHKNDVQEEVEETLDLPEVEEGEVDTTDWKAEATTLREKAIAQRERTKALKQQLAEAKQAVEAAKKPQTTQNASTADGLDETTLDYLDLKGISADEDLQVIESIVKKTGMTVRQALKDEWVSAKLTANKAAREVKDATPSSTRRSGGNQGTDLAVLITKYEQSGFDAKALPEDFALRSKIINAVADKQNTNRPSWH